MLAENEQNETRTAGAMVAVPLLTVFVIAMAAASIVGLTVFGDQNRSPSMVVVSGVVGMYAAVLGMIFGFMRAYQSS
jgi:hypothetical protein